MKNITIFAVIALLAGAFECAAQTVYTWTGAGADDLWSTQGNWLNNDIPANAPDAVIIMQGSRLNNVNDLGMLTIGELTVNAGAVTLGGDPLHITGKIIKIPNSNNTVLTFDMPLIFGNTVEIHNAADNTQSRGILVNGGFYGAGGFVKTGTGRLTIASADLPGGGIEVGSGSLWFTPPGNASFSRGIQSGANLVHFTGPQTFTLTGTNAFSLSGPYASWDSGGIGAGMALVFDGGLFSNLVSSVSGREFRFSQSNNSLVVKNGARYVQLETHQLGRNEPTTYMCYTNTVLVTGTNTVWEANRFNIAFNSIATKFIVDDGACVTNINGWSLGRFDNRLEIINGGRVLHNGFYPNNNSSMSGTQIFVGGRHPVTGEKAVWDMDNNSFQLGDGNGGENNATNNTFTISAGGLVRRGTINVGYRRGMFNTFNIIDGGEYIPHGTSTCDGSNNKIYVGGFDPETGGPTVFDLRGNSINLSNGNLTNNTIVIGRGGVMSNGTVRICAQYSGSSHCAAVVTNGGFALMPSTTLGGNGNQAGNAEHNMLRVTGEGSVWDFAGTDFQACNRGNAGWTSMWNRVEIDAGGVITNASVQLGYTGTDRSPSIGNQLLVSSGGILYGTSRASSIGRTQTGISGTDHRAGHALHNEATVKDTGSFWFLGNQALDIGYVSNTSSNNVAAWNGLRVVNGGHAGGISDLRVGHASNNLYLSGAFSNRVTLAGGTISCGNFTLNPKNILAVDLTPGTIMPDDVSIGVSGAATFAAGSLVTATRVSGAPFGRFVLLRASTPFTQESRANLKFSAVEPDFWRFQITSNEVILHAVHPRTIVIVR